MRRDYYAKKGYRSNLLYVGYWILQDQQALLSYSYNGDVMTIDPVSTANPGWEDFLTDYNQFCSDRNGVPATESDLGADSCDCAEGFRGPAGHYEEMRGRATIRMGGC